MFKIDMTSLMNLFQKTGFVVLCLNISFSTLIIHMSPKAAATFFLIAVP